jgi:radical SAM superfamily enzyme YgiQ (UPF0313 family)
MPPHKTLLVNPPLIDGVAFTRQGRCQEREDVLGTTKPPYSLALAAALLQERGVDVRLVDLTAERRTTAALIQALEAEPFRPGLVVFCSTTPTLEADVAEMARLKHHFGATLVCFGPHASTAPRPSMEKAPAVDAMIVGEPEEAILALADLESPDELGTIESVTWRRGDEIVPHRAQGVYTDFPNAPFPAWSLLQIDRYTVPLEGKPYVIVETSRGCPYTCDFCVAPLHQGHGFRERAPGALVDEIERATRELGVRHFYLWADTVTLNAKTTKQFCDELIRRDLGITWFGNGRADNLTDLDFVRTLAASGCWLLSMGVESFSDDTRKDMEKRLEHEKIRVAFQNLRRAGIRSFAFFILGYPGDTPESMRRTTDFALELDPDFANFYPAVPYPGTGLYEKCRRDGLLADEDWSKMEYSFYVLEGRGLNPALVMGAIARARRRFTLRPSYVARHALDVVRLAVGNPSMAWQIASHTILGRAGGPLRPAGSERGTTHVGQLDVPSATMPPADPQ